MKIKLISQGESLDELFLMKERILRLLLEDKKLRPDYSTQEIKDRAEKLVA